VIFDLVSNHSFQARRRVLKPTGIYVGAGVLAVPSMFGMMSGMITDMVQSRFVSQKFVTLMAKLNQDDLVTLAELMETGKVTTVIDRCYSLSEAPEAIRYLEQRHARGKIVITLEHNNSA
jgi:NADPH:quinone reductase-like Zn-dependent oxidoreductase